MVYFRSGGDIKLKRFILFAAIAAIAAFGQSNSRALLLNSVGAPNGTTVTYQSSCNNGSTAQNTSCILGAAPAAGYAIVGVIAIQNAGSVTSVCDGTGTDGCTGSSTYTIQTKYQNSGSGWSTVSYYTCNFTGSVANKTIVVTLDSSRSYYQVAVSASGNTTTSTNCNDGYNKAQQTTAGTAYQSATVATTNNNDLMVGLMGNGCGGSTMVAGTDGQGHTYTARNDQAGVIAVETLAETATGTYYAAMTAASCGWNAEVYALK